MNKGAKEERVRDKGELVRDKGELVRDKGELVRDKGELVRDKGELVCDERGERVCKRRNNEDNESVTIRRGWNLGGLADFLQ